MNDETTVMKLPQADVSEPAMFSSPYSDTTAYYVKNMQEFDALVDALDGMFDDRSLKDEMLEIASGKETPFPCWVTVTMNLGVVYRVGVLDMPTIWSMEMEFIKYCEDLREMLVHPELYLESEVP